VPVKVCGPALGQTSGVVFTITQAEADPAVSAALGTNWESPALATALYGSVLLTCARP
jgi:hypothetical protein